jgi:hypothetical protein
MFEELIAKIDVARRDGYAVDSEYRNKKYELDAVTTKTLNELFGARQNAARTATAAAEAELKKARDEHALAQAKPLWPVGTQMAEWDYLNRYAQRPGTTLRTTGVTGVVEIVTSTTVHPENKAYGRAFVGQTIIRINLKSGKPGKNYVGVPSDANRLGSFNWRPVGVDLNEERNAVELAKIRETEAAKKIADDKLYADVADAFYSVPATM